MPTCVRAGHLETICIFHAAVGSVRWLIVGVFGESLELQHFPFDCQDFTVTLRFGTSPDSKKQLEHASQRCQLKFLMYAEPGEGVINMESELLFRLCFPACQGPTAKTK